MLLCLALARMCLLQQKVRWRVVAGLRYCCMTQHGVTCNCVISTSTCAGVAIHPTVAGNMMAHFMLCLCALVACRPVAAQRAALDTQWAVCQAHPSIQEAGALADLLSCFDVADVVLASATLADVQALVTKLKDQIPKLEAE
jgi:hypothetical protein